MEGTCGKNKIIYTKGIIRIPFFNSLNFIGRLAPYRFHQNYNLPFPMPALLHLWQ